MTTPQDDRNVESVLSLDLEAIKGRAKHYDDLILRSFDADNEAHELAWDVPALVAEVERLRAITDDLPGLVTDMLNAWYAPSNPRAATAEGYRGLKHDSYGQRDFDGMVAVLAAALRGEE